MMNSKRREIERRLKRDDVSYGAIARAIGGVTDGCVGQIARQMGKKRMAWRRLQGAVRRQQALLQSREQSAP